MGDSIATCNYETSPR